MSGARESRAAVFTSQPQDVEIYRANAWWPGSLLGWRHDADGGCQAWVRTIIDSAEETTWLALDYLRLPEEGSRGDRHLTVVDDAPAGSGNRADDSALTGTMAAIRAVPLPSRRPARDAGTPAELTATMNLFAVRDVSDGPPDGAVTAERPRRAGGRRRAPEPSTGELPAVDAAVAPTSPGRHRAPATAGGMAGRHRAVDTGVWPAVRGDDAGGAGSPAPVGRGGARGGARADLPPRPRLTSAAAVGDSPDAHGLTRPMRLGDLVGPLEGAVPQPRRGARDERLSGV